MSWKLWNQNQCHYKLLRKTGGSFHFQMPKSWGWLTHTKHKTKCLHYRFRKNNAHYLCKSICLSAGAAFLATSCSLGALALPASKPPELSWLAAALFLPLLRGLLRSSFLVALPWDSDLGRRPLLGFEGAGGPDSSTSSSVFWWIFSAPAAVTVLFFPRSLLMLPWVAWSELIS